ncbi:MAG: hypothetical protein D6816_06025 [Bacteroidetes bacterium]|nr:MAG: hypothetical protein D6816_06025 [Bacteroidota bacterium]
MSKRLTTSEFIEKARSIHGDKYDYSKVTYHNAITKVEIVCPEHGSFMQKPNNHLTGGGCPRCARQRNGAARTYTNETFIDKANTVHGDKYDYSRVHYRNSTTKVEIVCPEHGSFMQAPSSHLQGNGCPKCAYEYLGENSRSSTIEFIEKARSIHGDKYDYSRVAYRNATTKVEIVCPEHGSFMQSPSIHLSGGGCPDCAHRLVGKANSDTSETFIEKARSIHGDKYDYSRVNYRNSSTKVEIVCPKHGSFMQAPYNHLQKQGCPECAKEEASVRFRMSIETFIEKARSIHGDKYDYSSVQYKNNRENVEIVCPKHGAFDQAPVAHLRGHGCPTCGNVGPSKAENDIADFVREVLNDEDEVIRNTRDIIPPKELDIYVPSHNLAIEYCGLYWHSDLMGTPKNYHRDKYEACRSRGIRLITIFEDEWVTRPEKVRSVLRGALSARAKGLPARKLHVEEISSNEAHIFMEKYHLQGASNAKTYLGLVDPNGDVVALMTFGHPTRQSKGDRIELKRFVTNDETHAGAASKLFKHFVDTHPEVNEIVSFSDNRWFTGEMYSILGFEHDGNIPPDYSYFDGVIRHHKSGFRKDAIKKRLPDFYDPTLSEREMMRNAGYGRIHDCGKVRWIWRRS